MKHVKLFEQFHGEENGIWVYSDNNKDWVKLKRFIDKGKYYAEWDEQAGGWWFPESPENWDALETTLTKEFNKSGIKSYRFEASV
tara:strand:- start:15870 stop:16124 length:255 start_codon:yes stop_codon:yes gene_type:complete